MNRLKVWKRAFATGAVLLSVIAPTATMSMAREPVTPAPLRGKTVPEFGAATGWINTPGNKPLSLASLRGKVVILTFWTFGCINCRRTVPYWKKWAARYVGSGSDVVLVSVHTPETRGERSERSVRAEVRAKGITFPVAIDNSSRLWNALSVQAWPTTILIDKQGHIQDRWEGELNWQGSGEYRQVEQRIEALRKS